VTPTLLSLNVGLPHDVAWQGRTVYTGIWKTPVTGPRLVRRLNIDGDGQGDLAGHGGEQRAVLVYQAESYRFWRAHLGRADLTYGMFGENFTVDGLADDEVCIGDRFRVGTAEFEVSQPRVTCFRLGLRVGVPDLAAQLVAQHRPGFYLRVLTEGEVRAGDRIVPLAAGPERLTVAEINDLLYLPARDPQMLRRSLRVPALSPGWQGSFRDLLDGTTAHGPAWTGFRRLRVSRVDRESATMCSATLEDPDAAALPPARAGQYLTLRVPDAGTPAPVRSYSLSSAPGAASYRISVKRETHGVVSGWLHDKLQPGALLEVAAPRGTFVLRSNANPALLISAGVGITPVLAMLHQLASTDTEREVWWLHAARSPAEQAFADEASGLLHRLNHAHPHVFYSADGHRLTPAALADLHLPTNAEAYLCGPGRFMADVGAALHSLGIGSVFTEVFGAQDAINPGVVHAAPVTPHVPARPPGSGPLVTFARSGLSVPGGEESLLELAEACDVPTRFSCRTGVCHTCATPLLAGEIAYDPAPLEPPTDGSVLICCARPRTEVVLDM
jgi:ferredoxin-NADP reductase/MOSC domain-containing protein YiiM